MPYHINENNSVNIVDLDEQHNRIYDFVCLLKGCANNLFKKKSSIEILEEMIEYTAFHFKSEEDLFTKYSFPEQDAHIDEHEKVLNTLTSFKDNFKQNSELIKHADIEQIIKWVEDHLLNSDMKYKEFFSKLGVN